MVNNVNQISFLEEVKMKYEMNKVDHWLFKEYYEGFNPETQKTVTAILDNNCVRWMSKRVNASAAVRHELRNGQEQLCLKNARTALNKK